jgi:integrase
MKARGTGLIFQPTYKDRKSGEIKTSSVWYIQYNVRGKRIRESSESRNQAVAARLLKKRIGEAAAGKPVGPDVEKTTLADLKRMIEDEYTANGRRSSVIKSPLAHLVNHFGGSCRAFDLTTDRVTAYITKRQAAGAANATINRSLAALKRAFRLAERAGRVATRPYIPMLEENNARSGFLSHAEFIRLYDALPEDLRDPVAFLYHSGWRVSEMRGLKWRDVDLAGGVVRLRPEKSKSKSGRTLPLRGELKAIIERAAARRLPECVNVFRRDDGGAIGLFRKSWATACDTAGLGAILVHDLRRTAVRNLVRAGEPEHTAMAVTGHKTASIFRRYDIVTEDDLAVAMDRVSEHLAAQPKKAANVVPLKRTAQVEPMSADQKAVGE